MPWLTLSELSVLSRFVKEVPFVNGKYTKGVPFLSKMVYKRVRGRTSGRSLPVLILFSTPSPGYYTYSRARSHVRKVPEMEKAEY